MIRYIRDLRLIPIALIASACLLTLKVADIALHGSVLFARNNASQADGDVSVIHPMPDGATSSGSNSSWAQQMFNFPDGNGAAARRRRRSLRLLRRNSPQSTIPTSPVR